jgi:hypothetical protein
MPAVFDSAIDKAFVAAVEAAEADAEAALLAAAALLEDFARSACSLLTCASSSEIRASMGLRSVHPAVITRKAKTKAFPIVKPIPLCQKSTEPMGNVAHAPFATQWTFCLLQGKRRDIAARAVRDWKEASGGTPTPINARNAARPLYLFRLQGRCPP